MAYIVGHIVAVVEVVEQRQLEQLAVGYIENCTQVGRPEHKLVGHSYSGSLAYIGEYIEGTGER